MELLNPPLLIQLRESRKLWVNQHVPGEKNKNQTSQEAGKAHRGQGKVCAEISMEEKKNLGAW